jgi:predicted small lipoprotein YifL
MSRNRLIALMLVAAVLALPLAACGKKNTPVPPPNQPQTYPGNYPSD